MNRPLRAAVQSSYQRLSPRAGKAFVKKEPKTSQGRITKTNVSVLSEVPLHERLASKTASKAVTDFAQLRLDPIVQKGIQNVLKDLEYAEPSVIQSLAIPSLLATTEKSYLLAAETGSGKTLAYLAPIVHHLKKDDVCHAGRPRAIILLPSIELVKQVGATVKALSHIVKLSSAILLPSFNFRRTKNEVLMNPVDILVTMPAKLNALIDERIISMKDTKFLVVDEADTMLDTSFQDSVVPIMKAAQTVILCSATIPRSMDSYLRKTYPDCVRLVSPKLHSIPRRIAMTFVDVEKEYQGNKNMATHQILRDLSNDNTEPGKMKKVILFVNRRESISEMCEFLATKSINAMPFSRDTPDRAAAMTTFLTTEEEGQMTVLVTTDLASRGIDTIAVKNVILYDVPYGTIDFLHRVGRTGRAGRRGRAFILVQKKRGNKWLKDIRDQSIAGAPLQ